MIETAIILAGGLGTRLQPLTERTPKPLLPLKGKPIMQHAIENLTKFGVNKIILSIGYKADHIRDFFGDGSSSGNGSQLGVSITYSFEREPLGTGGAIKLAAQGLEKPFFVVWGDNLMDIDYNAMYKSYLHNAPQICMALTPREDVEHFGVAKLDGEKIISFVEKPKAEEAPTNLINAGAFIIEPDCLKMLPEGVSSMERNCFEKLAPLGEISAFVHQGQWFPTDTMEKYRDACLNFTPAINLQRKKVIIADVDETICDSCQQISEGMARQINNMIGRGYTFAFISGTKLEDLQQMISSRLTKEHHLLATTGTNYSRIHNSSITEIYNHSFATHEKEEILNAFEELIAAHNIVSLTTKEDQLQDRESQITLSAIGRHAPAELKANFDPSGEKRQGWVNFMKSKLGDKYEIKYAGTTSVDITRKGLDKEWGIRKFAKHHGFALDSILFFGDKIFPGGNDYAASKVVDCISVRSPEDTLKELKKISPIQLR